MNYEIEIEDFDFLTHCLHIKVGDTVIFRLSKRVPFHAEHIIYGTSSNKLLCFESEVLQVQENVSYDFTPTVAGDIFVTCKIYLDMYCEIHVHDINETSESDTDSFTAGTNDQMAYCHETKDSKDRGIRQKQLKKESIEIVEGIAHRVVNKDIQVTDKESVFMETESISKEHPVAEEDDSDSFYDSDDEVSLNGYDNDSNLLLPDGFQSPISSLNAADIDLLFDTSPPLDFRKTTPTNHSPPMKSPSDPLTQQLKSQTITVIVNEFSFHPKTVSCAIEDQICFVLNDQEIDSCTIYCEGEFDRITLDKQRLPNIIHQFYRLGPHVIQNEVYNFVDCRIFVHDRGSGNSPNPPVTASPPKLSGSFPLAALPKPVFNLAAIEKKEYPRETIEKVIQNPDHTNHPFSEEKDRPYAEEEFDDMLQDLTFLNLDETGEEILSTYEYPPQQLHRPTNEEMIPEDETLTKHDGESIRNSLSSKDSKTENTDTDLDSCSITVEDREDNRHDHDEEDEEQEEGDRERAILPTSVSVSSASGYEGLSRKAKKKKKRKEKLKMLKKIQKLSQMTAIADGSSADDEEEETKEIGIVEEGAEKKKKKKAKKNKKGASNQPIDTQISLEPVLLEVASKRDREHDISVLSPNKDQESSYLLASADFSANFDSDGSDDEDSLPHRKMKEKIRKNKPETSRKSSDAVSEPSSPIIPKKNKDGIVISPVDKNKLINQSVYDEDVSFDSEEETSNNNNDCNNRSNDNSMNEMEDQGVKEKKPGLLKSIEEVNTLQLPLSHELLPSSDKDRSLRQTEARVEEKREAKGKSSIKNNEKSPSHGSSNRSGNSNTNEGGKTTVLLSALGLSKSKSIDVNSSTEPALETELSNRDEAKVRNDNNNVREVSGPLETKLEDFTNFLMTRFIIIQSKYKQKQLDALPRGRAVPILFWSDIPSPHAVPVVVSNATEPLASKPTKVRYGPSHSPSNTTVKVDKKPQPEQQPAKKLPPLQSQPQPQPTADKLKKVIPRGTNQLYIPPPARSGSREEIMIGTKPEKSTNIKTTTTTSSPQPLPPPPPPSSTTSTGSPRSIKSTTVESPKLVLSASNPSRPQPPVKTTSRSSASVTTANTPSNTANHFSGKGSQQHQSTSEQRKKA